MRKSILMLIFMLFFISGCGQTGQSGTSETSATTTSSSSTTSTALHWILSEDLAPEAITFDGTYFWTVAETDIGEDRTTAEPGEANYQNYIFRHSNDTNKTISYVYIPSHDFNIDGLTFDGTYLWAVMGMPGEGTGIVYKYSLDQNHDLALVATYEIERPGNGLAWDGTYLWVNTGPSDRGIIKYAVSTEGLTQIARYQNTGAPPAYDAKGLAYDGTYLWSAYKYENPPGTGVYGVKIILKHNLDSNLSILASYEYSSSASDLLNYHPGGLVWVNNTLYSVSSDPGSGSERGGRIVKHKSDLSVEEIYFYNTR